MPSNARACVVLVALVMAPWVRAADGAVADSATLANATSTITAMDAPPTDAADNDEKQSSSVMQRCACSAAFANIGTLTYAGNAWRITCPNPRISQRRTAT